MKRLSWLSVEDYGTTPLEIMVVSTMKGYLRQMPEDEALRKIGEIIEPKVIRLAGEDSAPMPVQSIIEGAKPLRSLMRRWQIPDSVFLFRVQCC